MEKDYVWSDTPQTINEILMTNKLPQVLKISLQATDVSPFTKESHLQEAILLCKEIKGNRVLARAVEEGEEGVYRTAETSPWFLIPEEYRGWFHIRDNDSTAVDQPEPLDSLKKVVALMPRKVLIMSRVTCFHELDVVKNLDSEVFGKGEIKEGEVLMVSAIHEGYIKYTSKRKSVRTKLERCLKCYNQAGKPLLLPIAQAGEFYVVYTGRKSTRHGIPYRHCVFTLRDIITDYNAPITVQVVRGVVPEQQKHGNIFTLLERLQDNNVVVCPISGEGDTPILMEMSMACPMTFTRALNMADLKEREPLKHIMDYSNENIIEHLEGIKIRHVYAIKGKVHDDNTAIKN